MRKTGHSGEIAADVVGGLGYELSLPHASLAMLAGKMPALIAMASPDGTLVFANAQFDLLQGSCGAAAADTETDLFPQDLRNALADCDALEESNPFDLYLLHHDNACHRYEIHRFRVPANNEHSELICTLGICQSDPAKHSPPLYDNLTGLANRARLYDSLRAGIESAAEANRQVALMLVNVDRFKNINDSLGVGAGDYVLKAIADVLRRALRDSDMVARLGSDEFVLVLEDVDSEERVARVAQKVLDGISVPVSVSGHDISCTASIGVSLYPHHGNSIDQLLKHADVAMTRAKQSGKNCYTLYSPSMSERSVDYLLLENDLRRALEQDEFVLYYQPQVHLRTGKIIGLEALIRWQHKDKGLVPPMQFIPLAEETGLIEDIGAWVLRHACERFHGWLNQGINLGKVAVNLSARQFRQEHFLDIIIDALKGSGLPPKYLEVEITESLTMEDTTRTLQILQYLHNLGLSIAIDDFGTGYSSLAYLQKFPINKLKIDRAFIHDLGEPDNNSAIAKSIIDLAHNMSMLVVAEGVERLGQSRWLFDQGCDQVQGYYFCKPLSEQKLLDLIYSEKVCRDSSGDCFII